MVFLNEEHYKVRGFCDHNQFAVVGMGVPARIKLFRAQALRAVGGNGRRFSHNPPDPIMLDIYDNVGVVVMDENRLFDNNTKYVENMGALVKRDRNHPSITIWSFCNEANGCEGNREAGGPSFREITYELDGSRPVLANMFTFNDLLSHTIDVQGFSHQNRDKLESCHEKLPDKPIFLSECCSCNTMRDEDEGRETVYDNPHYADIQKSFNARCTESNSSTNSSDGVGGNGPMSGRCTTTLVNRLWVVLKSLPHTDSTICVVSRKRRRSGIVRNGFSPNPIPTRQNRFPPKISTRYISWRVGNLRTRFLPRSVTRRDRFMFTPPLHLWNSL